VDDDEKVIGKLSGYRLSLHDCWMDYYYFEEKGNPISPRNIIDDMDSDIAELMYLFTDDFCIKSKYCKKLKQISDKPPPNSLYIKCVEVLAPYRGKKFGESLISNSIYMMGRKDDLVILQSVPLQLREIKKPQLQSQEDTWQQEMSLPNFPSDEETAKKKLSNYYKKLGFKKLTKDGLVFLILQHSLKGLPCR